MTNCTSKGMTKNINRRPPSIAAFLLSSLVFIFHSLTFNIRRRFNAILLIDRLGIAYFLQATIKERSRVFTDDPLTLPLELYALPASVANEASSPIRSKIS